MATEHAKAWMPVRRSISPRASSSWISYLLTSTDNSIKSKIENDIKTNLRELKYRSLTPEQKNDYAKGYRKGFIDSVLATRDRRNIRGAHHKNASTVFEMGAYDGMVTGENYARLVYSADLK